MYEEGFCNQWQRELPAAPPAGSHRICANFAPNNSYERHNRGMIERHGGDVEAAVRERMSWFATDLKPGVLYVFCYNQPPEVKVLMSLVGPGRRPASDPEQAKESQN
jgi:hypothetical protein